MFPGLEVNAAHYVPLIRIRNTRTRRLSGVTRYMWSIQTHTEEPALGLNWNWTHNSHLGLANCSPSDWPLLHYPTSPYLGEFLGILFSLAQILIFQYFLILNEFDLFLFKKKLWINGLVTISTAAMRSSRDTSVLIHFRVVTNDDDYLAGEHPHLSEFIRNTIQLLHFVMMRLIAHCVKLSEVSLPLWRSAQSQVDLIDLGK